MAGSARFVPVPTGGAAPVCSPAVGLAIGETARRIGHLRHLELRGYEALGAWASTPAALAVPEAAVFAAAVAHHHADRAARLAAVLSERRHDVLCLNDHDPLDPEASARRAEMVQSFLARYFPVPSSFERPRGPQQRSAHSSHPG